MVVNGCFPSVLYSGKENSLVSGLDSSVVVLVANVRVLSHAYSSVVCVICGLCTK